MAAQPGPSRAQIIANDQGNRVTPSYVAFTDTERLVGDPAKTQAALNPENTIYDSKRLIGRYYFSEEVKKARAVCSYEIVEGPNHAVRIQIGEETMAVPEISALVLREMKEIAEARLGEALE